MLLVVHCEFLDSNAKYGPSGSSKFRGWLWGTCGLEFFFNILGPAVPRSGSSSWGGHCEWWALRRPLCRPSGCHKLAVSSGQGKNTRANARERLLQTIMIAIVIGRKCVTDNRT